MTLGWTRSSIALLPALLLPFALETALPEMAAAQNLEDLPETATTAPVALVADSVSYDNERGTVTASGNVEVFQGQRTLTAREIVYNNRTGRISATGPLVLRDAGGTAVLADAAELDAELRDGIIEGARAVIATPDGGGGTLAAVEGRRVDGRFNVLSKAVYSPCEVCLAAPTPLWQIRARQIVHDQQERMVYYEDAVFDVMGVPVAYLPFFSHPDPTVERKSGFLAPTFSRASTYGLAAQIPYFIALDESRDITLTAFPTTKDGPIAIGEYRQAFDSGTLRFVGSFGVLDTATDGGTESRGHLFGEGRFSVSDLGIGPAAEAGFTLELTSDDAYLARYDFSDQDRLESVAYLQNYGESGFYRLRGTGFESLRDNEPAGDRLFALPEFEARTIVPLDDSLGLNGWGDADLGRIGLGASGVVLSRPDGRDVARISLSSDWEASRITDLGFTLRGFAEARLDTYTVRDDANFGDGAAVRLYPQAGMEARYPLIGTLGSSMHLIEPGAMLVLAPDEIDAGDIPNEDSQTVEFDEANIFSTNRFPGYDRVETGTRLNLGVRYTRLGDDPFRLDGSLGRVLRVSEEGAFTEGSGLAPQQSDWVASLGFGYAPWLDVTNRFRIDDDFNVNRAEIEGSLTFLRGSLSASYVFLDSDAQANSPDDRAEFNAAAELAVTRNWEIGGRLRRDLENDETVLLAGQVAYRTECAELEFFVGRDFPDRRGNEAETSVGVRVQLFGVAQPERRRGVCAAVPGSF
jgi:LPS-assembly protein